MKIVSHILAWFAVIALGTTFFPIRTPSEAIVWIAGFVLSSVVLAAGWYILGHGDNAGRGLLLNEIEPATPRDLAEMRRRYFHS